MSNFLERKFSRHKNEILATLGVSLGPFAAGLGKGYSSPALASLQESGNAFPVSAQEGSWVASLPMLGAVFGTLFGGALLELGRQRTLILVALPFSFSWILTFCANDVKIIYFSSFIGGCCSAIILLATQVYVSEISHPQVRGCLSSFLKMAGHLGTLLSFGLGAFLDWRKLAGVAAAAPVLLFFALLIVIPESPSFLLYRGREEEAAKSLVWLRSGNKEDVSQEMESLRNNILPRERGKKRFIPRCSGPLFRQLFTTCGLTLFQKFSGVTVFFFYAVPILKQVFNHTVPLPPAATQGIIASSLYNESLVVLGAEEPHEDEFIGSTSFNPHAAAISVVLLQLLGSILSGLLMDTVGRLPLLTMSNLLVSSSFFGFGLYSWMEESLPGPSKDWIPLICVLFFSFSFSIGIGPISPLMVCELLPLENRSFGSAVSTAFGYACAFVAVKTYVDIREWIGLFGAFWIYGGVPLAGLVFVCFALPETRGKELEEIGQNPTEASSQPISSNSK